jgi:hypothetical protein
MNIAKALKVKSRLVGDLQKAQALFARENSRRDDNVSKLDVPALWNEVTELTNKVVALKSAISLASANAQPLLVKLAEFKARINFLNSIQTKEGVETTTISYSSEVTKDYTWSVFKNSEEIRLLVKGTEQEIDNLQDQIDTYNAITQVNFKE